MRKLASIQKIKSLSPIEGADRIELAHILGWQVVVGKDQFKVGDYVVYFEIDSFLPIRPEYEFLRSRSYKKNEVVGEGFRLRTLTLRGELSQGLIMPLNEVFVYDENNENHPHSLLECTPIEEGIDVTKLLGVKEWEIPVQATSSGTVIGQASGKIHVTDETRIQSEPELLNEFKGLDYYITLKMDGSSHSVRIDADGKFHVFGHNYEYADDGKSSFYEYVKKHNVEEKMRLYMIENNLATMTIQGEWCGSGIQNNRLGLKEPEWFVFTVDENEIRVGLKEILTVVNALDLKHVPVLETGNDLTSKYVDEQALLERAGVDDSKSYANNIPEGIVIRPVEPIFSKTLRGPLSMKVINNNYLIKNKE